MKDVYTLADLEAWECLRRPGGLPIRLGVFGHPVAHSRSPEMQNAALAACGLEMQYARFEIAPEELPHALQLAHTLDFVGVNLTLPHKMRANGLVGFVDEFALAAGAINTVRFDRRGSFGTNTDGRGFAAAICHEFGVALHGLRVVLLGAGGAARAIAMQCARDGCGRLTLINRTAAHAQQLGAILEQRYGVLAEVVQTDEQSVRGVLARADLLVNATSVDLLVSEPPLIARESLHANLMVYDANYGAAPSALLVAADEAGAKRANGLSMLLHQGALAFETWFGRAAPVRDMAAALAA